MEGLKPKCEGDGVVRWQCGKKTFLPSRILLPHCQPYPPSHSHIGLSLSTPPLILFSPSNWAPSLLPSDFPRPPNLLSARAISQGPTKL